LQSTGQFDCYDLIVKEPKTRPTDVSVVEFLDAIPDEQMRDDCRRISAMMETEFGVSPVMWGPSIIGFGLATLTYSNGRTLDWPVVGFAPRAGKIALYGLIDNDPADLLARLGKHSTGKGCLYVKRLSDIDSTVLSELTTRAKTWS